MVDKSYAERIRETFNNEVIAATEMAYNGLVESFNRSKLPEPIFRQYFLPYFTGEIAPDKNENVFAQWVGVAGSSTSEVDIIDTAGKVLFTVPALYNTSTIDVNRSNHKGDSFKDIYTEFQHQNSGLPVVAANYFARQMSEKLKDIVTGNPPNPVDVERWETIRKFYNIKTPETNNRNQNKTSSENDDDLVYGDDF